MSISNTDDHIDTRELVSELVSELGDDGQLSEDGQLSVAFWGY